MSLVLILVVGLRWARVEHCTRSNLEGKLRRWKHCIYLRIYHAALFLV